MAESTREIKRRIRSVKSTQKITKAMKMVAAAKLRRAQESLVSSRPYTQKLKEVLGRLIGGVGDFEHSLLEVPDEGKICYLVISGDRGLAGGYNANILRLAHEHVSDCPEDKELFILGKKGRDFFRYRGYSIYKDYTSLGDTPTFSKTQELAEEIMELFNNETFREVHLFYNSFISPLQQKPEKFQLLPIKSNADDNGEEEAGEAEEGEYLYEPSPGEVLGDLLPNYVKISIYHALLEAKASEHGARMTAMDAATNNAEEMIDNLTLTYNRARQAAITKEISEIASGAEALKG